MKWRPIETAPKDGTMLELVVRYSREADPIPPDPPRPLCSSDFIQHPLESEAEPSAWDVGEVTYGFNNLDNDGEDLWQLCGYNMSQDTFCDSYGEVLLWRPRPLPPALESSPWQPMETAPADGTHILLHCKSDYSEWHQVGYYQPAKFHPLGEGGYYDDCGWTDGGITTTEDQEWLYPVAWMPLPPLPGKEVTA